MRPNRGNRDIAIQDVSTAFLQSAPFPEGVVKLLKMRHPITKEVEYFQQSSPIYGEASAPVRWEKTIAPWLVAGGLCRDGKACLWCRVLGGYRIFCRFNDLAG